MMNYLIQLLFVSLLSFLGHAQEFPEDEVVRLNFKSQSYSISEYLSDTTAFFLLNIFSPNELIKDSSDIILVVETDQESSFPLRSWMFPPDTTVKTRRDGHVYESITTGIRNVQSNVLHVLNPTKNRSLIQIEDGQPVLVQEAKNKAGDWVPIEYFIHSGCGNSYSATFVPANTFLSFNIARYDGDFETMMRVKMSIDHKIYYNNEYSGCINASQFTVDLSPAWQEAMFK
jgi:hypothetical protein